MTIPPILAPLRTSARRMEIAAGNLVRLLENGDDLTGINAGHIIQEIEAAGTQWDAARQTYAAILQR